MVSTNFLKISRESQQKNAIDAEKSEVFFMNPKSHTQTTVCDAHSPGRTT